MDQTMHSHEEFLPSWAIATTAGELVIGAQLSTKDGRRTGNAHIINVLESCLNTGITLYTVLTDAGNTILLTADEIEEMFHPTQYVSDVAEVLSKFQRKE